ncbi:hypothetical protein B0H19DRAFT_1266776 [Mycena capillaripes]|nr:hypothetical protein B0H19DRAFT_1266776 [Mycena capillaripes]
MLGLTGIECTPSYIGRIKPGRLPLVLRNLHLPAIVLNTLMITLVLAIVPLERVLGGANVLSVLAEMSAGPWLRKWIVLDAVVVLCGGVLAGIAGILSACELFEQLAHDRIVPQIFLAALPLSGAPHISVLAFKIILQIFAYLTDAELLSLASISKQFHTLTLLSYLGRYDINETNISNNSYPLVSTSGAFPALCIARFIVGVEVLHVWFDPRTKTQWDVRLLDSLVSRLPPIQGVHLEFPGSWNPRRVVPGQLKVLYFFGPPCDPDHLVQRQSLPPDALPRVRSISAGPSFLAWILASENPFHKLTVIEIQLYKFRGFYFGKTKIWDTYRTSLRGLARLPTVATLKLAPDNFYPWDGGHFDPMRAPELNVTHVVRLQLYFRGVVRKKRTILLMAEWLRLFPGLRDVKLIGKVGIKNFETLCALKLERELPQITFNFRLKPYMGEDLSD